MDDPYRIESACYSIEKILFSVAEGWRGTYHRAPFSKGQECCAVLCCAIIQLALFSSNDSGVYVQLFTSRNQHQPTVTFPCPHSVAYKPKRDTPKPFHPINSSSEIQPLLPPFRPTRHGTRPSPTSFLGTYRTTSGGTTRSGRSRRPTGRSRGRRNRPRRRWR